jgi:hypothetical protein
MPGRALMNSTILLDMLAMMQPMEQWIDGTNEIRFCWHFRAFIRAVFSMFYRLIDADI